MTVTATQKSKQNPYIHFQPTTHFYNLFSILCGYVECDDDSIEIIHFSVSLVAWTSVRFSLLLLCAIDIMHMLWNCVDGWLARNFHQSMLVEHSHALTDRIRRLNSKLAWFMMKNVQWRCQICPVCLQRECQHRFACVYICVPSL